MLLTDKVCLITGAASLRGIGRATAKLFASHGAKVVILDLDAGQAEEAARSLGEGHLGSPATSPTRPPARPPPTRWCRASAASTC